VDGALATAPLFLTMNGDVKLFEEISKSYDDIGRLIEKPKPNNREILRAFLETNRLIFAFFSGTFLVDHKRVSAIWTMYKILLGIGIVFAPLVAALIFALATGRAAIVFID
jgi:hypothetical protein